VGTYFLVRDGPGGKREAAFRGRRLVGCDVGLPEGYGVAAVARTLESGPRRTEDLAGEGDEGDAGGPLSGDQVARWDAVSEAYPSFAAWTHDGASAIPNGTRAAAEWLHLAAAVHRHVPSKDVDAALKAS